MFNTFLSPSSNLVEVTTWKQSNCISDLSQVLPDGRQVWQALSQLGQALQTLASAALGESTCNSIQPLSLSLPRPTLSDVVTVQEAINEFLRSKARIGRSDVYLKHLGFSLKVFSKGRANTPLDQITIAQIEDWLQSLDWMPRTKKGLLCDVKTLFAFAHRRNLVSHNPAAAVESPVCAESPPALHTPEQVRRVLEFARAYDLDLCRCMAIRYFTGLRTSEVLKLVEEEIREGFIEVTAAKSKTRRRRLVTVRPCLRAWLDLGGRLPFKQQANRLAWFVRDLATATQIPWPRNVTRHSFASYHLAQFENAGKTALEAGHTEQILFSTYRELVTPAQAADFWSVLPGVNVPATGSGAPINDPGGQKI